MELQKITSQLDVADLRESVNIYIDRISSVALTLERPDEYDSLRTQINTFIKEQNKLLDDAFDKWDEPLREYLKEFTSLLENLTLANKDFSTKILETKKEAFRRKVREEYEYIVSVNENGEYIPFDLIYDPSWYNCKNRKEWVEKLRKAYDKELKRSDPTKREYEIQVECTLKELAELETLLITNNIYYKIERK